jgi:hypothetical protein
MFVAFVASVVAEAARPETELEEIVAAVVRTPPVVVTTTCPEVDPIAPAVEMFPWKCVATAAPIASHHCDKSAAL